MSTAKSAPGARVVRVPPPVYFAVAFASGLLLHAATGDHLGAGPWPVWLGGIALAGGLVLIVSAVAMFVGTRTTIVPHHRVVHLVTTGPFRLSRNPMYVGLALACGGGAFLAGTWWPLATLVPAVLIVRSVVIAPEERYLAEAFGPTYSAYCARVRRWL